MIFSSIGKAKVANSPALGEMGTAGFGVELEHSLPILVGGFRPDGFGRDDGLGVACSEGLVEGTAVAAEVLESSATRGVDAVADVTAIASSGGVS